MFVVSFVCLALFLMFSGGTSMVLLVLFLDFCWW